MSNQPHEQQAAIQTFELTHYYNSLPAVDKISFFIPTGAVFGLLGPNGAGKSTTIKMLTTLLPPTSGTAEVVGFDIIQAPEKVRQSIGYVPQLLSADGDLTGYENLLLSAKLQGLKFEKRQKRIAEVLEFMGLSEFKDELVSSYSGGMIRRLEIAQALVHEPKILFLDEPTVGLDPAARKALWQHIQELRKSHITILLTTHDMDEADRLCDIVAFMHLGRIVAMDTPENLKAKIGPEATLDDVFIQQTGTSIKEVGDFSNVQQVRRTISHLD
jgi:ABC-2 type transport system ATP-binding protein